MREENGLFYKNKHLYISDYRDVKTMIIKKFHQGLGEEHLGRLKTLEKITRNYYWEKINQDITKFVKSCDTCQRTKSSIQKPLGMLNPIQPAMNKFDNYSLDFIGPLPITTKGYDGILVIVDTF